MTQANMNELVRLAKLGRRAEKRGEAMLGCLGYLTLAILVTFGRGWFLMLAVGVIRHDWWHGMPTVGFWPAVAVVALLGFLIPNQPSKKKNGDAS